MATLSGEQLDLCAGLRRLVELDLDATCAYRAAVARLEDLAAKRTIEGFQQDHWLHAKQLRDHMVELGMQPPDESRIHQVLSEAPSTIENQTGDRGILASLLRNEQETNADYELLLGHVDLTPALKALLQRGADDERRHRTWLEAQLVARREDDVPVSRARFWLRP